MTARPRLHNCPSHLRKELIVKQGGKCFYCRVTFGSVISVGVTRRVTSVHYDHVIPYAFIAGVNPVGNWVAACGLCNNLKSGRIFTSYEEDHPIPRPAVGRQGLCAAVGSARLQRDRPQGMGDQVRHLPSVLAGRTGWRHREGVSMSCPHHKGYCAFPEWTASACEYCHAPWDKITRPATVVTARTSRNATPVEETRFTGGYGEMPLNHLWRHAVDGKRAEADAARVAARRKAVA